MELRRIVRRAHAHTVLIVRVLPLLRDRHRGDFRRMGVHQRRAVLDRLRVRRVPVDAVLLHAVGGLRPIHVLRKAAVRHRVRIVPVVRHCRRDILHLRVTVHQVELRRIRLRRRAHPVLIVRVIPLLRKREFCVLIGAGE